MWGHDLDVLIMAMIPALILKSGGTQSLVTFLRKSESKWFYKEDPWQDSLLICLTGTRWPPALVQAILGPSASLSDLVQCYVRHEITGGNSVHPWRHDLRSAVQCCFSASSRRFSSNRSRREDCHMLSSRPSVSRSDTVTFGSSGGPQVLPDARVRNHELS